MTLTGPDGEVLHGYFRAATLGAWSFVGSKAGGALTAAVKSSDAFRMSQGPLRVSLPIGAVSHRWPIVSLQFEGSTLTATLGEKD